MRLTTIRAAALSVALLGITTATAVTGTAGAASGPTASAVTIDVHTTVYGPILVTSKGDTLYLWAKDTKDMSACTGPCLDVWPDVLATGTPKAGTGVNQKLLGTIKVKDGNEVTYDGHPLYTYISDVKPGVISGENNNSFKARWYLVSPTGSAITKKP
jgi:predicted lipoprotein with Yx(FWY)xxD motif